MEEATDLGNVGDRVDEFAPTLWRIVEHFSHN